MLGVYLTLLVAIIAIYLSCELFINAIEWVGKRFNVAQHAVGTVLAAFGTALPESVVTFVAVTFNASAEQKDIGVGAALGGPLVLGTIAYATVGLCILVFRKKRELGIDFDIDHEKLSRDQFWFSSIFIFKVLLGLVLFSFKPLAGFLFLAAYAFYVYREMQNERDEDHFDLDALTFQPSKADPATFWIVTQTVVSLAVIFVSSHIFVKNLGDVSTYWNISPLLVSLLLSPLATELPEILNAVIWVRQGKENLAMGNVSGAMMIQATVPSAFGIFFTPWMFDRYLLWAGVVTLISIAYLRHTLKQDKLSPVRLIYAGLFYVMFAGIFLFK